MRAFLHKTELSARQTYNKFRQKALQFLNENKLTIKNNAIDCKDSLEAISSMKIEHAL